jgi:hypothetical protein
LPVRRIQGREIVFGFMLALACVVFVLALTTSAVPIKEICEQSANSDQKNCTAYGVLGFLGWLLQTYNGAIQALSAVFVAAFTLILARLARDQSDTTKILQRAYIAVDGAGIDPLDSASVAHIVVRNSGNLPARNVKWFVAAEPSFDGSRSDFPINEAKFFGNNVVSPGTDMVRSQNFLMLPPWPDQFRGGHVHIYVWGEIRYLDGFGNARFTRFCHRYGKRGLVQHLTNFEHSRAQTVVAEEVAADSMRYHRYGNDAD